MIENTFLNMPSQDVQALQKLKLIRHDYIRLGVDSPLRKAIDEAIRIGTELMSQAHLQA